MKFTDRMILVPAEGNERMQLQQDISPKSIQIIDRGIESIVEDKNMSDDEKWKFVSQLLNKMFAKTNEARKPIEIPIVDRTVQAQTEELAGRIKHNFENILRSSVPKTRVTKTMGLYNFLHSKETIMWDSNGVLVLNGVPVTDTNIVDLIIAVTRDRKQDTETPPQGFETFVKYLKSVNTPQEYISNPVAKTFITTNSFTAETPQSDYYKTPFSSPGKKRSKRKRNSSGTGKRKHLDWDKLPEYDDND